MEKPNNIDLLKIRNTRPQLNGWAPGNYTNTCYRCEEYFTGDKRAVECSDCAYATKEEAE